MKALFVALLFIFSNVSLLAQTADERFQRIIQEGISLHDASRFEEAIKKYELALEIKPNSGLAHYEMSYSYMGLGDYKNSAKHAKKAIKIDDGSRLMGYVVYGSALDEMGKREKALQVYKEGIKEFNHYLLHYNYGLTAFRLKRLEEAKKAMMKAIEINPAHPNSHLILSAIMEQTDNKVRAMLSSLFYLFLDPSSEKSKMVYQQLVKLQGGSIVKSGNETTINISGLLLDSDADEMESIAVILNILQATKGMEIEDEETGEKITYSDEKIFDLTNSSLFSALEEKQEGQKGFFWEFYAPFYIALQDAGHMDVFNNYVATSQGEKRSEWAKQHEEEYAKFAQWLEENKHLFSAKDSK